MLRVILVDHMELRAELLRRALTEQGHEVIAVLTSSLDILERLDLLAPDVVLADMQSPDRDTIEDVRFLMHRRPCPVVMYAGASDRESIARAIDAGVSAYVTEDIDPNDLQRVLDEASLRFDQFRTMRDELREAQMALKSRKLVDKAKSLLVSHQGLTEQDAHRALQQMAMNQRISISQAADNIIAMLKALPEASSRRRSG
ncbi:ANTAR domain-containing protein [Marinihelvus fidelis]|uniref:ANTAR domain-containing protein n=1 Tax=Marinihelvus fidelis TaxID=2613842 RepID=A0A5N0T4N9_9GAMM|nr:ANTAR domain-containing protein [Marinihelvus fidelis]KAA9129822.1 ANTAR domain-containing protein [Marinihelvus fidelis]